MAKSKQYIVRSKPLNGPAALGAFLGALVFAVLVAPVLVMLGTDYLHEFVPAVPELGFVPALVACITARALLGTGGGNRTALQT